MEQMDVVAIVDDRKVEVEQVRKPKLRAGHVLLKMDGCALCTWEQRVFTRESKMPLPFVGGHEIAGEIAGIGEGIDPEKYLIGKKVVARLIRVCGECYYCRHGEENLCVSMNDLDLSDMDIMGTGGLSQFLNVEPSQVYFVPDGLPTTKAVFAEPLACVLNSIERGQIEIGDDAVVIGGGIMGLLHVMCAKLRGARVILSEPDAARRKVAEELGCDITIDPTETDPVEFVKSLTEGRGAEAVFNTTPISAVAKQAIEMVAPMGRVVMYSSQHPDKPIEVSPNWLHATEAVITGAVSPSVRSFSRSVNLLSKGLIDPEPLCSGAFDYHDAQTAFETAIRPDTFRVVVTF